MANITNAYAIAYANNYMRPAADHLGKSFNRGNSVNARWNALGANQAALNQMQPDILYAANELLLTYDLAYFAEKNWFLSNGPSTLFINDGSLVYDNNGSGQRTDAPGITGAMVNNLITRLQQFQNWLLSATGSFTDAARGGVAWFNTVMQCSSYGPTPIVLADAGNFLNRCGELLTNYQANTNANLNSVLAVAVNPNFNPNGPG